MLCDHVSYYFAFQLDYVGFQCSRDGYVFEGSMNVTQYAFCSGGQWIYNFDLDAMCERKLTIVTQNIFFTSFHPAVNCACPPGFLNDSYLSAVPGKHDWPVPYGVEPDGPPYCAKDEEIPYGTQVSCGIHHF